MKFACLGTSWLKNNNFENLRLVVEYDMISLSLNKIRFFNEVYTIFHSDNTLCVWEYIVHAKRFMTSIGFCLTSTGPFTFNPRDFPKIAHSKATLNQNNKLWTLEKYPILAAHVFVEWTNVITTNGDLTSLVDNQFHQLVRHRKKWREKNICGTSWNIDRKIPVNNKFAIVDV